MFGALGFEVLIFFCMFHVLFLYVCAENRRTKHHCILFSFYLGVELGDLSLTISALFFDSGFQFFQAGSLFQVTKESRLLRVDGK